MTQEFIVLFRGKPIVETEHRAVAESFVRGNMDEIEDILVWYTSAKWGPLFDTSHIATGWVFACRDGV